MSRLPDTRDSLLVRLRDHADAAAWSEFVSLYEPWILGWAKRQGFQDADARELCQDLLVRLAGSVGRWKPGSRAGSFRSWLSTTAKRLAIDYLSRPKHRAQSPGGSDHFRRFAALSNPTSDEQQIATDYRRRLFEWAAGRVRDRCGATTWEAFRLTCLEGQSAEDTAIRLGISLGQVYVARSRVLARLRESVGEWNELDAAADKEQ